MVPPKSLGYVVMIFGAISCGPAPDYTTQHGVHVFSSPSGKIFLKEDVERTLDFSRLYFAQELGMNKSELDELNTGLSIRFEDEPIIFEGRTLRGYYQEDWAGEIVLQIEPCLGATPLAHEMIHALYKEVFGFSEEHPSRFFGGTDTPEQRAWSASIRATCP